MLITIDFQQNHNKLMLVTEKVSNPHQEFIWETNKKTSY